MEATSSINLLLNRCKKLKWLNLTGNSRGLSSIDNPDWYSKLSQNQLSKVVFIPEKWISDVLWENFFKNRESIKIIEQNTWGYYNMLSTREKMIAIPVVCATFHGSTGPDGPAGLERKRFYPPEPYWLPGPAAYAPYPASKPYY
jgi:hypothetical protein